MNKLFVGLLVMLGFGSCCKKPAKSTVLTGESAGDTVVISVPDIRMMYGVVRPTFDADKLQRFEPIADTTENKQPSLKE